MAISDAPSSPAEAHEQDPAAAAGAGLAIGVLTGVGERVDLEPFADLVMESVGDLRLR